MSAYEAVLGARVRQAGRAIRKTTVRHFHLSEDALFLSILRFGGERFRPVVFQFSELDDIDQDDDLITIYEYTKMAHLLEETDKFASKFFVAFEEGRQIIVPNAATIKALGLAGRALAFRNRARNYGLSKGQQDHLEKTGRYLIELERYSRTPGQSLILPLAESVASHWATLTAPFERADLTTLDAQIEPQDGDVFVSAMKARGRPFSVGPNMHPAFEEEHVYKTYDGVRSALLDGDIEEEDLSDGYGTKVRRLRKLYAKQTLEAHETMHRVVRREMEQLPEAPSSQARWEEDSKAAQEIIRRVGDERDEDGRRTGNLTRYFARQLPTAAARTLQRLEGKQSLHDLRSVLDDEMLALPMIADGSAIAGVVREVSEPEHTGKGVRRVTFVLECDEPVLLDTEESTLIWEWQQGQRGWVIHDISDDLRTVTLSSSLRSRTGPAAPEVGQRIHMVEQPDQYYGRVPGSAPWTHGGKGLEPPPAEDVMSDEPVDDVPDPEDETLDERREQDDDLATEGIYE